MIDDSEVHDLVEQFIRDKWSDNSDFQFLLKTDSAQSIANKVATGLENIVNVYRGSEGDREIIPLDKPEQITFGDTALSDDDIRTIAVAKIFDDILGIPVVVCDRCDR